MVIKTMASNAPKWRSINKAPVTKVTIIRAGISLSIREAGGFSGLMIAAIPNATPTLNMFDPRALPMANSGSPSQAEAAEENISGAEVPNATIVSPIIRGETPQFRASAEAPNTNLSAPQIRPINPRMMMTVSRSINRRVLSDFEEADN